ncbi:uncharacterized protein MYCFIDRAFT_169201 [Pseudocercospora fijiensis CIRAD86]|uniref:Uncharacterized protein n=1 Tax=Pseudocercospora fijiensis (strain CIRAD86) TaxID=383855 RepID=N1Q8Z3_PSEFD|nr:uncharacterized protein MYCFIDRAFT_169201 [Pseudocercospora fijiensis CIRAD86]EME87358.1 hypothetical protein MYCFIDRAFT_169201 [Pseudocercospora fijiensis CIRAD86]
MEGAVTEGRFSDSSTSSRKRHALRRSLLPTLFTYQPVRDLGAIELVRARRVNNNCRRVYAKASTAASTERGLGTPQLESYFFYAFACVQCECSGQDQARHLILQARLDTVPLNFKLPRTNPRMTQRFLLGPFCWLFPEKPPRVVLIPLVLKRQGRGFDPLIDHCFLPSFALQLSRALHPVDQYPGSNTHIFGIDEDSRFQDTYDTSLEWWEEECHREKPPRLDTEEVLLTSSVERLDPSLVSRKSYN